MLDRLSREIDADPSMYAPGNAISVSIELDGQTKSWRFVVVGEESILSMGGRQVPVLHLLHYPENDKDARLEVWLVPQLAHRPIQMLIVKPGELNSDLHTARMALDQIDQAARNSRSTGGSGILSPTSPGSQ